MADPRAIATWRSDTCRALTSTNYYQEQLYKRCIEADTHIMEYLQKFSFSKNIDWESLHQRIMDRVLKPAATLGTALVCSPEDYAWSFSFPLHFAVEMADIADFDFIDCSTHCSASKGNICGIQDHSKFGYFVAPIFPGLCRDEQKKIVTIQKPLMLVAFRNAPPNPSSPSEAAIPYKPPQTRQSSGSGGSVSGQPSSPPENRPGYADLFSFMI